MLSVLPCEGDSETVRASHLFNLCLLISSTLLPVTQISIMTKYFDRCLFYNVSKCFNSISNARGLYVEPYESMAFYLINTS